MGKTVTEKIIERHLVKGKPEPGSEIALKIDHALAQDATGTMVFLEFMALGVERVRTEVAVAYVDHNLLQTDFKNADDHRFLGINSKDWASGSRFSKAPLPITRGRCVRPRSRISLRCRRRSGRA